MSSLCNVIPQQNKSVLGKKQISIHSEDRDILKYPSPSNFTINLPEKIEQIKSLQIMNMAIPMTIYNFSEKNFNTKFYVSLESNPSKEYLITIDDGHYCAEELVEKIEQKLNSIVNCTFDVKYNNTTQKITIICSESFNLLFNKNIHYGCDYKDNYKGIEWYLGFDKKTYKSISGKNKDHLENKFPNERILSLNIDFPYNLINENTEKTLCSFFKGPDCNLDGITIKKVWVSESNCSDITVSNKMSSLTNITILYHGIPDHKHLRDKLCFTINNYTLFNTYNSKLNVKFLFDYEANNVNVPSEWNEKIIFNNSFFSNQIESPKCINIIGDSIMYLEIDKFNSLDELVPYPHGTTSSINSFNTYGGRVNSALTPIPLKRAKDSCGKPGSVYYIDSNGFFSNKKEFYYNTVESMKTLKFKFRFHDGRFVDFSGYEIFFTLEFEYLKPDGIEQFSGRQIRS